MFLQKIIHSLKTRNHHDCFFINNQMYSYNQFALITADVIFKIKQNNTKPQQAFGVVLDGSIQMYASILALWATRNIFIPINLELPFDRNFSISQQSNCIGILINSDYCNEQTVKFTDDLKVINTKDNQLFTKLDLLQLFNSQEYTDEDILYILFTSGSTGVPKGVPINIANVEAFIDSYNALKFNCNENDRFLQMFELTFDVSIASFIIPLQLGASIYTINKKGVKYLNIYKVLRDNNITFASLVPSVLNFLKQYFKEINLPLLKYCILTAEASNVNIIKEFSKCIPNAQIVNLYGPTEATIWCTGYFVDIKNCLSYNEMLMIGKPFKNVKTIIVNEENQIVEHNVKGELCLCSSQLTSGYLNNTEKNKSSFFIINEERYYRTGDLCYTNENDEIYYCGRLDNQVKIQGYRIELSEIEVCVRNEFNIENAAITINNQYNSKVIIIFAIVNSNTNMQEHIIMEKLKEKLPYYMVPEKVYIIKEFPLNNSGKLDRVQLQKMAEENAKVNR